MKILRGNPLHQERQLFLSAEEDASYLVSSQGYYVLDRDGNRIALPKDLTGLNIATDHASQRGWRVGGSGIVTFPTMTGCWPQGKPVTGPLRPPENLRPWRTPVLSSGKLRVPMWIWPGTDPANPVAKGIFFSQPGLENS